MFAAELCAKVMLPDLLQFITGADKIPPLGFPKDITICFYDKTTQHHNPTVSTCHPSSNCQADFCALIHFSPSSRRLCWVHMASGNVDQWFDICSQSHE